jgi:hypothetical protein
MMSLDRHATSQAESATRLRYEEVLDNLALIANSEESLPAYSSIFTCLVQLNDTGQLMSTTIWQYIRLAPLFAAIKAKAGFTGVKQQGFMSQAANPQLMRQVLQNWSLDPVIVPEKLEAMRSACRWVVYGPERLGLEEMSLLKGPDQPLIGPDPPPPGPNRHFNVADRLARLPSGWLHVGCLIEVPPGACYKAHCGGTWVWVMPEGRRGLADFTLVLHNIARVDSNSPTLFNLAPNPTGLLFKTADPEQDGSFQTAAVVVDQSRMITRDQPFYKIRIDNIGADSHLRTQINSAGGTR